jgi:hypothetical protein
MPGRESGLAWEQGVFTYLLPGKIRTILPGSFRWSGTGMPGDGRCECGWDGGRPTGLGWSGRDLRRSWSTGIGGCWGR